MTNFFGTDGIRGTVGMEPLTPEFFLKIGKSVGKVLVSDSAVTTILIGRDTRLSGQMLQSALVAGLLSSRVNVIDAGIIPSPAVAWLVKKLNLDAGAVISASHNPVDQNGVKFFTSDGDKLSNIQEHQIEELILKNYTPEFDEMRVPGQLIDGFDLCELYIEALIAEHPIKFLDGLNVLLDCSNGAVSIIAPKVFHRAGANIVAVNSTPTGTNINVKSGSEYARRFPIQLGEMIRKSNSLCGLAFDGDADRVVFVEPDGKLIDGDQILGFLAKYLKKQGKLLANSIVTTSMRNEGLNNYIEELQIKMYETPVGDKYVVEKLRQLSIEGVPADQFGLGGEQAGHIVLLNDEFTTGDGIRTALYTLRAFVESGEGSFIDFASKIRKTPQIIASAILGDGPRYDRDELDQLEINELKNTSGLSRVNLRYSGTEPIFRTMIEANFELNELDLARLSIGLCKKAQLKSGNMDGDIDILNCTQGGMIEL